MQKRFELLVENQKLVGDLYLSDGFEKPPIMIFSHGRETNRKKGDGRKLLKDFLKKEPLYQWLLEMKGLKV